MSTKIAVQPYSPDWKDTISLGHLEMIIDCFYKMGYDLDTPVTYLFDETHVWLETVHEWEGEDE